MIAGFFLAPPCPTAPFTVKISPLDQFYFILAENEVLDILRRSSFKSDFTRWAVGIKIVLRAQHNEVGLFLDMNTRCRN